MSAANDPLPRSRPSQRSVEVTIRDVLRVMKTLNANSSTTMVAMLLCRRVSVHRPLVFPRSESTILMRLSASGRCPMSSARLAGLSRMALTGVIQLTSPMMAGLGLSGRRQTHRRQHPCAQQTCRPRGRHGICGRDATW